MARVIDKNKVWYLEVAPRSFYDEEALERAIIQNLEIIFPQFKAFPFKKSLQDFRRLRYNKPDLAMVKSDYSEWYIIEVELGKHSLEHVLDQIETFYYCDYREEHARYMQRRHPVLDLSRLKKMVDEKEPELMVIVNEPKPDWIEDLRDLRCKVCVFQIYHDFAGNALYRLNGEHPYIYTHFCHCKYQKEGMPFTVEVLEKKFLDSYDIHEGDKIKIEFRGLTLQWEREDAGDRIFLQCHHTDPPLDPLADRYRLNYNEGLNIFSFTKD
jgi:hypothetical protein